MQDQDIIGFYLDSGVLISPSLASRLKEIPLPIMNNDFSVITPEILDIIKKHTQINSYEFEKAIVLKEKHKDKRLYDKFMELLQDNTEKSLHNNAFNQGLPAQLSDSSQSLQSSIPPPSLSQQQLSPLSQVLYSSVSSSISSPSSINSSSSIKSSQSLDADTLGQDIKSKSAFPDENILSSSNILTQNNSSSDKVSMGFSKEQFLKDNNIRLLLDYNMKSRKRTVNDFVNYFNARYKEIEKILHSRKEMQNLLSISRINSKKEKENVALIGYIYDKIVSKNNNIILTIEDPTGFVKAAIRSDKEELFTLAQELQLDEVIGITGTYTGQGMVFANNLLIPDIPLTKELKKSPEEGYFLLISDTQVGNKRFLEKEFMKMVSWLNGESGSDQQKDIASKIKYIFIVGDVVEGVGVYPDQEYDLLIIDIKDQYLQLANYLRQIPSHIPIIISPGNHDVGRLSEPQPGFHDEYSRPIQEIPNVICVSNPSLINIYSFPEQGFEGFDVLLYHGGSFFYYFANVPSIRKTGTARRPDLVMKYLLQRRHLAPSHTSTLYVPDPSKDPLTVDKVPDFFFSGHIHRANVLNYKNVTCINASCWVSKSEEEERRGLEPQPGRAFLINMQTREIKIMNFLSKEDQDKEQGQAEGNSPK